MSSLEIELDPTRSYQDMKIVDLTSAVGLVPEMIRAWSENAYPKYTWEQFADLAYGHGGGWRPLEGFTLGEDGTLDFAGDPPLKPYYRLKVHGQTFYQYPHAWVAWVGDNTGDYQVARMD